MCGLIPEDDIHRVVGFDLGDDAGVYLLEDGTALVQTVDVITPLVDDSRQFGRIAAANAISDIYAMGAKPLTALNIVTFPDNCLPLTVLSDILQGGLDACREASCALMGGHTLRDDEIKYGLAVTGIAKADKIVTNAGARPGDALVLTKPIGTGLISTAIKRGKAKQVAIRAAVKSMITLNRDAAGAMTRVGAHACTDITGFGLLGHASQLARASGVTLVIRHEKAPLLPHVLELAKIGMAPGGTKNNIAAYKDKLRLPKKFERVMLEILFDPQTSGGLLIALPEEKASHLLRLLKRLKTPAAVIIGSVTRKRRGVDIILE